MYAHAPMAHGRILVVRGGAIGDFILTLPVLAALRRQLPQARLEVLGYPHIAQLALAGGLADAVHPLEGGGLAGFFALGGNLDESWQEFFAGFALIISYLYDPDRIFQGNVARCSRAQFIVGPHRPEETGGLHAARVFCKPLERLAIFDADLVPRLQLGGFGPPSGVSVGASRAADETVLPATAGPATGRSGRPSPQPPSPPQERRVHPFLAVHPGSGSPRKNWPEAQWQDLLRRLAGETGLGFLLLGGEAEGDRLDRLAGSLPRLRVELARSLPLVELARKLATCDAFVGHDSGITHLAAAVGLPALVLWGDTPEGVWRPQGSHVTVLRKPGGLATLAVEAVLTGIQVLLAPVCGRLENSQLRPCAASPAPPGS
jgi:heptosyltransferase III